jgi:hypothetical protein
MASWASSMVAVVGTLLGATLAYLFQRANAIRAESFQRDERLRQKRIAAYSAFAGAKADLRQGSSVSGLVRQRAPDGPEFLAAYTAADRLGATANHARMRVQLLTEDQQLVALANAAFGPVDAMPGAGDRAQLVGHEKNLLQALNEFVSAAGREIRQPIKAEARPRRDTDPRVPASGL